MINQDTSSTAPSSLLATLVECGRARHVAEGTEADAVVSRIGQIGNLLGRRTAGRAGALEEIVRPRAANDAHPRSLSARHGLNALPFHVELSHRPRPCRYLLLGCIEPGSPSAVTMLLDWRSLGFSQDELHLLEAPVLVRTGRHSFYSTILSPDRAFLRYDPCCLEAVEERGRSALRLMERRLALSSPDTHQWRRGDILIIDNWRILHARGPSARSSGRRLVRILIDA
jgi:hypothetical protein